MKLSSFGWLFRRSKTWIHLHHVPMRHLAVLLVAVFLLFSIIGFYVDLMSGGVQPYAVVAANAVYSGLNAALWLIVLARLPTFCLLLLGILEAVLPSPNQLLTHWIESTFHLTPVSPQAGIHFAATAILILVINSYGFFSAYMGIGGREAFRLKNELALAQSIQKTLVPPLSCITASFEIYGISEPSEKVGGDLVDVAELEGGDTIAYVADIAGHGLQAGILMGMLKTAARTALAGGESNGPESTEGDETVLSLFMHKLNVVLPQVKESHMYATFTGLRLNLDGRAFYGMAGCPPLLLWQAARGTVERIEEQQFPLGLLPVAHFPASGLAMEPGDIAVIATDGILEVASNAKATKGQEFGVEALEALVSANARLPLPELAAVILSSVRKYGKQLDDQTLLLVRRRAN